MTMRFRYRAVDRPAPFPPDPTPSIPVTLVHGDERLNVMALLDSGADTVALPRAIAEILGIPLTGKRERIGGIKRAEAVTVRIVVHVAKGHESYAVPVHAKVILDGDVDIPVLLGREGFFEPFAIEFREREEVVSLKKL
ncbi:MAG: hypothetical protein HY520_02175 [Candidatus Aenigmarchaeota archaeon]|nr:hypothetical protein [Candidatus Aenigmarchaeota archaeon]